MRSHVKRAIGRILLATSLAISLLSLIAWPLSYFVSIAVAHVGDSSTYHCWTAAGQLVWMRQSGNAMPEFFRHNGVEPDQWVVEANRYRARHYDSVDRWNSFRASLRFDTRTTSINSGGGVIVQRLVQIPFWPIAWLFAMPPAIAWQRHRVRRRRIRDGLCARCGYDLRASPGRCPECGLTT